MLVAVGQENAFPWIERDAGIQFDKWGLPVLLTPSTFQSLPKVFFGGDAAFGPKNIITAVAHGHEAAVSIDRFLHGEDVRRRPPPHVNLMSQKMGIHEWSYHNDVSVTRFKVPWAAAEKALASIKVEVELGFDAATAFKEAQRCLNCDVQTVFNRQAVHRMRCLRRHLPDGLHHLHRQRRRGRPAQRLKAPATNLTQDLYVSAHAEDGRRDGQGRGRLPALRPVRRALPHRRLGHAEVPDEHHARPARAAAMPARNHEVTEPAWASTMKRIEAVNDFVIKFANVNGSGSASANELFAKAILRMGVPVSPRNIFPSNIQGLPTWYEVRVCEARLAGPARRHRHDGGDEPADLGRRRAEVEPGGYLFYDSTRQLPPERLPRRHHVIGMPVTAICNATYEDARQRSCSRTSWCLGALSVLMDMDARRDRKAVRRAVQGQGAAARIQRARAAARPPAASQPPGAAPRSACA